jgi:hypothetical protein
MVNLGKMNVSVFGSYLIFRKSSGYYGFCENIGNQTTSGFGFCWVRIKSKNHKFKFFRKNHDQRTPKNLEEPSVFMK